MKRSFAMPIFIFLTLFLLTFGATGRDAALAASANSKMPMRILAAPVDVLSNIGASPYGSSTFSSSVYTAVGFTTNTDYYAATSVTLTVGNPDTTSRDIYAWIYSDSAGEPDAAVATFTPGTIPPGGGDIVLSLATPFPLLPSTTYWIVVNANDYANSIWTYSHTAPSGVFTLFGEKSRSIYSSWTDEAGHFIWSLQAQAAPAVGLSASSLNFSNTAVGSTSSAQTVTVTNTGDADLHIGTLSIGSDYALSNDTCSNATIATTNTCTFDVSFSPTSAGAKSESVSIPSDAATSPDTVSLSGTGIQPDLVITKTNNVSGSVLYPNTWRWTVRVTNTGTANAVFSSGQTIFMDNFPTNASYSFYSYSVVNYQGTGPTFNLSGADLSATTTGSFTLLPGSYLEITYTVTPSTPGTFANPRAGGVCQADPDNVIAESNEGNNTCSDTVAVTAPAVSLSTTSINFGNSMVNVISATQTVTVTNSGDADLHIGTLSITGDFALSNDNCSNATVTAGNNCTFDVTFTPLSYGSLTGSVSIPSDAPTTPDSVSLSGTGVSIPPTGTNLLKKPTFEGLPLFPFPWVSFGGRLPYASLIDCSFALSPNCSIRFDGSSRFRFMALTQKLRFSGLAGDSFSFGLSSAAQNIPASGNYRVEVFFFTPTGKTVGLTRLNFTPGTHDWETLSGTATAPVNFKNVALRIVFQKSGGSAWFDDAFLIAQ